MVKFARGSKITLSTAKFLDYPGYAFSPQEYQVPTDPRSLMCSYAEQSNLVKEVIEKKIFNLKYGEKIIEKMSCVEKWFVKIVPLTIEEESEVFEIPMTQIFCPDLSKIPGDTVGPFNNLKEIIAWSGFNISSIETSSLPIGKW